MHGMPYWQPLYIQGTIEIIPSIIRWPVCQSQNWITWITVASPTFNIVGSLRYVAGQTGTKAYCRQAWDKCAETCKGMDMHVRLALASEPWEHKRAIKKPGRWVPESSLQIHVLEDCMLAAIQLLISKNLTNCNHHPPDTARYMETEGSGGGRGGEGEAVSTQVTSSDPLSPFLHGLCGAAPVLQKQAHLAKACTVPPPTILLTAHSIDFLMFMGDVLSRPSSSYRILLGQASLAGSTMETESGAKGRASFPLSVHSMGMYWI